jgi:hypothetical protein
MMRRLITAVAVAGALLAGGCGPAPTDDKESPMATEDVEAGLRQKPSFEAAQADYRAAVESMADRIAALTPGTTWAFSDQTPWLACSGDYIDTNARHVYFSADFEQPIPDTAWPQALQIVRDGAARFGATDVSTFQDEPGDHDVAIAGADGVEFKLGTKKKASLTAQSDCRLTEADKGGG